MKLLLLTVSLFLFNTLSFSQLSNRTLSVGAASRTYKQYIPSGFDPQNEQVSVIIAFHGIGGTSNDLVGTGLNLIADTARILVFYPQGLNNGAGQASWNNGAGLNSPANDLGFVNQLIDSAILNYNADPSRIYVCGFSMGSIMSYHLACLLNNRIAAIGGMSGTMADSDISTCNPTYLTPVIHFHGTSDGTVPYDTQNLPTVSWVPETMNFWKNVHGCSATADSLRITDSAADGITVDRFRYDNCNPTSSLELWRMNGADHDYMYQPLNDFTEIIELWLFLRRWSHTSPAAAGIDELNKNQISVSPNPSAGVVSIESSLYEEFSLLDAKGSVVMKGNLKAGVNELDFSFLTSGLYILQTPTGTARVSIR